MPDNHLFYGDNLDILRRYVRTDTIDLVYLDPPFKSNQDYNVLFAEQDGSRSAAQIQAFQDTWRWDQTAARAYQEVVEQGGDVARTMIAFRQMLGDTDMLAYLAMMAPRLVELWRVLKSSGSIYLHCDQTASAYLRLLMDAAFGPRCFRNEIIWSYRRWPSPTRHYQRMHDVLLFYARMPDGPGVFHVEYEPNSESYTRRFKGKTQMLDPETGTRKITLDEASKGLPRRDVWDISIIAGFGKERLGYPTQKPEALLERIIRTSTNEGDSILDPFCGCGTAVSVAHRLRRRWTGIDITQIAINLIKTRLQDAHTFDVSKTYDVTGEPVTLTEAQALAGQDKYQFQWWALGQAGARAIERRKGADRGIDGQLFFHDEGEHGPTKQVIFSVKGGAIGPEHLRDLRGVVEREGAAIGVLLTLHDPTPAMRTEAASGGFYRSPWRPDHPYPRVQILTIHELLDGKRVDMPPPSQVNVTYRRAPKARRDVEAAQSPLFKIEGD